MSLYHAPHPVSDVVLPAYEQVGLRSAILYYQKFKTYGPRVRQELHCGCGAAISKQSSSQTI